MLFLYECGVCKQYLPLDKLFYCSSCQMLRCSSISCVTYDIDYYYCPYCFDTLTNTELRTNSYRCGRCYECPMCHNQLQHTSREEESVATVRTVRTVKSTGVYWKCYGCNWNSIDTQPSYENLIELRSATHNAIIEEERAEIDRSRIAAECIRFELGIKDKTSKSTLSPYLFPFSMTDSNNKQQQERQQYKITQQQQKLTASIIKSDLPTHATLRVKSTIKCYKCSKNSLSCILSKPHIQPLLGDSSLVKGHDSWLRVASLGVYAIPQFSTISIGKDSIVVRIRNPAWDPLSNIIGTIALTFNEPLIVSFVIPAYDEITVDVEELKQCNKGNELVRETGMNYIVVTLPIQIKSSTVLKCSFSFVSPSTGEYKRDFCVMMSV